MSYECYECRACLEPYENPVKCPNCKEDLCRKHIDSENRCPFCDYFPFFKEKPNPEFVYECITSRHRKFSLYGHTESIFSISISSNNDNIISGSYDTTIRLWNLHTKTCIAIFKGHFSPILSVKFSPLSHYFASGGCDKTARLWSINSNGPLRIFIGHLSDVEIVKFHPNSLYLITSSNDKTIRLWSIKSGDCVRIFVNYSKVNSFIFSLY